MKRSAAEKITGEIILFLPLILLAVLLNIKWAVLSSMLTFFISKWQYNVKGYFHFEKSYMCAVMSYGIFLFIGIFTRRFADISPYMANQPMLPIILSVGATITWAYAGDIQYEYTKQKQELAYIMEMRDFKLEKGCSKEKLLEICRFYNINESDTDFLVKKYIDKWTNAKLTVKFNISTPQRYAANLKKKMNIK